MMVHSASIKLLNSVTSRLQNVISEMLAPRSISFHEDRELINSRELREQPFVPSFTSHSVVKFVHIQGWREEATNKEASAWGLAVLQLSEKWHRRYQDGCGDTTLCGLSRN